MTKLASPADILRANIVQALHKTWTPSPWQIQAGQALFRDHKKVIFLQCGRKAGKSEFLLYCLIRTALENPNSQNYYCAPFLVQARELITANNRLQNFVPRQFFDAFSKSQLRLTLTNGSFIKLGGADNPDSFRGIEPHMLVLDEVKDISQGFIDAMLPNLDVHKGAVIYAGTPPPAEGVYTKLSEECQANPDAFWIQVPTTANPHIDKEGIEKKRLEHIARGEQDVFAREYEGRFVRGGSRSIFPMLDKSRHVMPYSVMRQRIEKDINHLTWYVVMDPGNSTVFGVILAAHNPLTQENWIFSEIHETRSTHTSISLIMKEVELQQAALNLPESTDWNYVCDEAAKWASVEIQDRNPKIFVEPTRKAERPKEAGLSLIKDLLLRDKFTISNQCKQLWKEMENYTTKEDGTIVKARDHLIDTCRYFLGSAGCALSDDTAENEKQHLDIDDDSEDDDHIPRFLGADLDRDRGRDQYGFEEDE